MSSPFDRSARSIDCPAHLIDRSMGCQLMDLSNGQRAKLILANLWSHKSLDSILLLSAE